MDQCCLPSISKGEGASVSSGLPSQVTLIYYNAILGMVRVAQAWVISQDLGKMYTGFLVFLNIICI